jgi:predicted Zn-dependent protease
LLAVVPPPASLADQDDPVSRAMADELARSMESLRVEGLEAPYFISYRIDDTRGLVATASFGALSNATPVRSRTLSVELRVGDYQLDNTNFLTLPSRGSTLSRSVGGRSSIALDDDYQEIRRQIWLATDAAFKSALEQLAQKKAVLQNKTLADDLADFSAAEPAEIDAPRPEAGGELADLERLAVELSRLFRDRSGIFDSYFFDDTATTETRFVSSEGARFRRTTPTARVVVSARTQAADGMRLNDFVTAMADRVEGLPSAEELAGEVNEMTARLEGLREAELLDRYNGPVLFEGQAAAELFAQGFARELLAQREPLPLDERFAAFLQQNATSDFRDRVGARVLPRSLSVSDDPTLADHLGRPLLGAYEVDDQGVPANATTLIERGYLRTLLSGRTPVVGVEASSGNWRDGGVVPSNLVISTSAPMTDEELLAELLLLVADRGSEFGVIVRRLGSSSIGASPEARRMARPGVAPAIAAFKVYPDGREVPLRNVTISGLAPATFKEIVGAGSESIVYHLPFRPALGNPLARTTPSLAQATRGGASDPLVSVVVPALLFEEVTLKKPSDEIPSLPFADHPYFATRAESDR